MYKLKTTENGLKYIEITNNAACGKIAIQGAHLFHYAKTKEEPILWLSDESFLEHGEHIRGGVPICWPSFGFSNPELPPHGFARNRMWDLVNIIEVDKDTTEVIMDFKHSKKSLRAWDYKFHLTVKFTLSKKLTIELTTVNLDEKTFKFTQALHTYFNISNIDDVSIKGLENKPYLDALTNEKHMQEGTITFNAEVDAVYQEVDKEIILKDKKREVTINNEGSSSVVVWNPWIEKGKGMSGMAKEGYKEFVCIETANAFDDCKFLETGESHTIKVTIS
ncbi:D-hexose-6-phosphate mutarotase [Sulfurimonas sp. SAG-AH-194-I05]|nr:D-hexose-6-phosphate mutarotase [Sulfurimonas sp. SAG-AH-194-I05]MDF1876045.1 D-hexose-6-phosphate mutarotase [Sulfurimonas sp. SAG-AH-194-I05]